MINGLIYFLLFIHPLSDGREELRNT